jgi:hypothetical protein
MKKYLNWLVALSFSTTVCVAEGLDPTFNGLATELNCQITSQIFCDGDNCFSSPDAMSATTQINFQNSEHGQSTISRIVAGTGGQLFQKIEKVLRITEVSPATLNSKLSVKFKYDGGNDILVDGTVVLFPTKTGTYVITLGLVSTSESQATQMSSILRVNKIITSGSCTIQASK